MSRMRSNNPFNDDPMSPPIPNEPPPAYGMYSPPAGPPPPSSRPLVPTQAPLTRQPTAPSTSTRPATQPPGQPLARSGSQENRAAMLRRFDTVILVDDSASMVPLWSEVSQAMIGIVEMVVTYDADGIDIYFLCSPASLSNVRSTSEARELFSSVQPVGESTPTEVRVEELLGPYVETCEQAKRAGSALPKPLNFIVITDGAADDPDTLAYVIKDYAARLDHAHLPLSQLGIQFVQIGNDAEATEALRQLDDDLAGSRDIVDTTPYAGRLSAEFILKAVMGGVNRRMDASSL